MISELLKVNMNGLKSEMHDRERQFVLIKAVRFPLIVLVVFAHSLGFERVAMTSDFSGWNVFHFFSEMISHNFARLAVCWFYVFSGYLFFCNLKNDEFSFKWVWGKWKKRFHSLFIPYVIWNIFALVLIFLKNKVFVAFGFGEDEGVNYLSHFDIVKWFWSWPADFPLYFMRDLMLMSLIVPLWYYVVRYAKLISLVLLVLVYISPLNPSLPAMRAIFFFGLGAWMGIWKIDMLKSCRYVKWPAAIMAVVTLIAATWWNASDYHEWFLRAFYPFGMISFMNLCDKLAENEKRCQWLCSMASTVFIIYAVHELYILSWTKGLFLRVFGEGLAGAWISYLFVPVVVIAICLLIYSVLDRFFPKTLAFVSGGRIERK